MSKSNYSHVLFDLDGTLLDSAMDITHALNHLRKVRDLPPLEYKTVRPIVSLGSPALLKLALNTTIGDKGYDQLRLEFFKVYERYILDNSEFFPGAMALLDKLDAQGTRWGIVTNKVTSLTKTIMKSLKLDKRAATVVCADTTANKKPHPEPIIYACKQIGCNPQESIYIGDAKHDILAAHAAGMPAAVVTYGYIPEDGVRPEEWGAEYLFKTVEELTEFLTK